MGKADFLLHLSTAFNANHNFQKHIKHGLTWICNGFLLPVNERSYLEHTNLKKHSLKIMLLAGFAIDATTCSLFQKKFFYV